MPDLAIPLSRFAAPPLASRSASHREPDQEGWRRFIYFLFVYMTFEGLIRRNLPYYNLQILLVKDGALLLFYAYFLLCVYPGLPKWPHRDKTLTFLSILFVVVNVFGIVRAGASSLLPIVLGLKANFWYVPMFFIGRRYFTSFRQIRQFWLRLAWLLLPVAAVAIWQVLFGQFSAYVIPTATVGAENWAAAGAGSLRNNTDGSMIATVSSTFFGARLAAFAAIWVLVAAVLCLTDQTKARIFRMPYLYVTFGCALIGLFLAANRTAVALAVVCLVLLLFSEARRSVRFLIRLTAIAAMIIMVAGIYRVTTNSDVVDDRAHSFTSFIGGLLDADAVDVRTSRYSVVGGDIIRGIQLSLAEVGPLGRGLGLITQGAVYINADLQRTFEVQKTMEAQADSQWVRLVIELGIPGLILYIAIALGVLWRIAREAIRVRQRCWADGLTAALAPLLLVLYLGLAHKHAGFAVDPMMQCYVFFTLGAVFGVATRENRVRSGLPARMHGY